jgi:RHS repeat-associated protein
MRIFSQGQHNGTTPYFFTRDHLGSVREVLSGGGTVAARYDYDPYGRSTTILGTTPTDMNFTGLYRHSKSNLDLAVYRAYDPDLGRWLNRDPIAEKGGLNLYGYVGNNPANAVDLRGLSPISPWYGRWGGPDWANGEHRSETGRLPTPGDWSYRSPIDNRDLCYERHDHCISMCYNCGFDGIRHLESNCVRSCDYALAKCLRGLPPGERTWKTDVEAWMFDTLIPALLH